MAKKRKTAKLGARKKARKNSRDWRPAFLAHLAHGGIVKLAAEACGITRSAAYLAKKEDEVFAAQWAEAEEEAIETLEAIARARAETISDTLLIFLLKAQRPEKYRERYDVTHKGGVQLELVEEIVNVVTAKENPAA